MMAAIILTDIEPDSVPGTVLGTLIFLILTETPRAKS